MMGQGFGAAAGAYLLVRPMLIFGAVCIGLGVGVGYLLGWLF